MKVKAKFEVVEVRHTNYGEVIILQPRYDMSIEEDVRFNKATPTGRIELTVNNPNLKGEFELGQKFYINMKLLEESP